MSKKYSPCKPTGSLNATRSGVKRDVLKMDDELAEFKRNKDFIIAQSKAAEVKNIYEAKARISKKQCR